MVSAPYLVEGPVYSKPHEVALLLDATGGVRTNKFYGIGNTMGAQSSTYLTIRELTADYPGQSTHFYSTYYQGSKRGTYIYSPTPTYFDITPDWTLDLYTSRSSQSETGAGIGVIGPAKVSGATIRKNLFSLTWTPTSLTFAFNRTTNPSAAVLTASNWGTLTTPMSTLDNTLWCKDHIAIVRSSQTNMFYLFKNGTLIQTAAAGDLAKSTDTDGSMFWMGRVIVNDSATTPQGGSLSDIAFTDLRITRHVARWTSNFENRVPKGNLQLTD